MTGRRVLVIDDEKDYLKLMAGHLTRKGFDVATAENGRIAMDVMKEEGPFEVLVVDLMMPEVNGLEFMEQARKIDPWAEAIVVSGAGTLESAISSMRQGGAFDYLPKPLSTMNDLSLAVSRAADYRRLRMEREELQAQIAAERERLRVVIASAGEALISADADGRISVGNPSAFEMFGGEGIVGQDPLEVLPPSLEAVLRNWLAFDGDRAAVTEVRWPEAAVHMVSLTPILPEGESTPQGWVMILRDVTQLRRMQEQKMRLLARAASQIRGPLAQAFSTVVELNEFPESGDERFTAIVGRQVDQLSAIRTWTDDLLALVEIEAGGGRSDAAESLDSLMGQAAAKNEALIDAKSLKLEVASDVETGPRIDRNLGRRLLEHMLRQAVWRATPQGEISLRLSAREGQFWLEIRDDGPRLRKTGSTGMFESFMGDIGDLGEGVGMSLAMIKSIADVLGGQLWLSSHRGGGNTISMSLPIETN